MHIKDAINQVKDFRNPYHQTVVNLLFTNNWLVTELRDLFKTYDITEKQYNILRILNGSKTPLTTSAIRKRLLDKKSDTTRVIDRMIKKHLVQKRTNEQDRRLVDISLTESGRSLLAKIDVNAGDIDAIVSEKLSSIEAEALSDLLDRLRG